jgi:hypothetical protein
MHPPSTRVVYRNQPYLLEHDDEGAVLRAYGPFTPGTEPALAECGEDNHVHDPELIDVLTSLVPLSPSLPAADDSLAG